MKSKTQGLIGIICLLVGTILGVYFGIYWGVYGGVMQILNSVSPEIIESGIAFGIIRIFFLAPIIGWGTFTLCYVVGISFLRK